MTTPHISPTRVLANQEREHAFREFEKLVGLPRGHFGAYWEYLAGYTPIPFSVLNLGHTSEATLDGVLASARILPTGNVDVLWLDSKEIVRIPVTSGFAAFDDRWGESLSEVLIKDSSGSWIMHIHHEGGVMYRMVTTTSQPSPTVDDGFDLKLRDFRKQ
jgi:hypothetical protein